MLAALRLNARQYKNIVWPDVGSERRLGNR
jgi:hypothetical protein